jgi:subtilisin family serine protease
MRLAAAALLVCVVLSAPAAASVAMSPNDPAFDREWGPRLTHASELWDRTTGDRRIVIAVLDTGIAPIPEVRAALVPGWDFVEGDATPQDTFGHGTWVASAIAAQGNNGRFGAGYCWGCGLMPVRVSDGQVAASTDVIARAIRWSVDHGARIITISLTGQGDDPAERAAVEYAAARNVLVVASAGNTGDDEIEFPAAYPSVLSVAGTDPRDHLYRWSTRGTWISLAAPGCATVVHVVIGAAVACGSSFAPPAVAGIAGLLLSLDPSITAARLATVLRETGRPVDGLSAKRIDAEAALVALGLATPIPQKPSASAAREVTTVSGTITSSRIVEVATAAAGRLEVQFISVVARQCEMQMRLNGQVIVAFRGDDRILTLEARVARGRHRLTISCASRTRRPFELRIEKPAASS